MSVLIRFWSYLKFQSLRFIKEDKAASGIEYVLIAVMVAVAIAAVSPDIRTEVGLVMQDVLSAIKGDAIASSE
ncbi:Flp family type IVb pilin [Zobellella denitrificans]|jgi:Flp pilus assembly pilin Flp|uniref:Pilin n=1 Tax=Zobellella denitrificans TaxID=347534 RepID=A0A291HQL4_9GAMM|nr:Flp family type IVb pilin [Zobellella denitrificans]ATG74457.1 hypothetical protein AN401_11825 [Zobellella denitrificans]